MGTVLTISTSKGGAGKTSLAMALAAAFANAGRKITVVDADRNATFSRWVDNYYEGPAIRSVVETDHNRIGATIADAAAKGLVIVDTAGFENQTAAYAMGCADLVLIPCMPDSSSTMEAVRTAATIGGMENLTRHKIPYRVVRSRWNSRGLAERAALSDLQAESLPLLETVIPPSSEFAKASFSGVVDQTGRGQGAAVAIIAEIKHILSRKSA